MLISDWSSTCALPIYNRGNAPEGKRTAPCDGCAPPCIITGMNAPSSVIPGQARSAPIRGPRASARPNPPGPTGLRGAPPGDDNREQKRAEQGKRGAVRVEPG